MVDGEGARRRKKSTERDGTAETPIPTEPVILKWIEHREETIKILKELKGRIETVCFRANCGKFIGNAAEILGAISSIVGAIMSFYENPSAANFTNIGNLAQYGGSITDDTSKLIESCFSEKYMKKVVEVLMKDKEISKTLDELLQYTMELKASVEDIFKVSLASGKLDVFKKVISEFLKYVAQGIGINEALTLLKQGKYSIHIGNDVKIATLTKLYNILSTSPLFPDMIHTSFSAFLSNPDTVKWLEKIKIGAKCYEFYSKLQSDCHSQTTNELEVSTFCIFQAINMACSYFPLINALNIIKEGKSKHSDALREIIENLEKELEYIKSLHFNQR